MASSAVLVELGLEALGPGVDDRLQAGIVLLRLVEVVEHLLHRRIRAGVLADDLEPGLALASLLVERWGDHHRGVRSTVAGLLPDARVAVQVGVVRLLVGRAEAHHVLAVGILERDADRALAAAQLVGLVVVHDPVAVLLAVCLGVAHVDVGLGHLGLPVDGRVLPPLGLHALGDLLLDLQLLATLFDGIAHPTQQLAERAHRRVVGRRRHRLASPSSSRRSDAGGDCSSSLVVGRLIVVGVAVGIAGEQVAVDADHDPVALLEGARFDRAPPRPVRPALSPTVTATISVSAGRSSVAATRSTST